MIKLFGYITYGGSEGIDLGIITLHYYSLMWIFAFLFGWFLMSKIFKIDKVSKDLLDPLFLYTFVGAIAGARLGQYLFYEPQAFIERPIEVFLPVMYSPGDSWLFLQDYKFVGFMGLASHGATLGVLIAMYFFTRKHLKEKSMLWIVDRLAVVVPLGGAMVRIGNFINSEIVGKPSSAAWAVLFEHQSSDYGPIVPRHPAQLYEALGYVILAVIMWTVYRYTKKKYYTGFLFGLFFSALWLIRFLVEFFKENQGTEWVAETLNIGLNNGQLLSIPFIIIGLYILFTSKNRIQTDEKFS